MAVTVFTGGNPASAQRVELDVTGMSCASCADRVERQLNKADGVRASVNFATQVATIEAGEHLTEPTTCVR